MQYIFVHISIVLTVSTSKKNISFFPFVDSSILYSLIVFKNLLDLNISKKKFFLKSILT